MPQQPVVLELSATISDKTFPIGSFTVNIPVKVTHTEVNTFKVGGGYTTLITPKPPSTDELITRFTNAVKAFKTAFETNPDGVGRWNPENHPEPTHCPRGCSSSPR